MTINLGKHVSTKHYEKCRKSILHSPTAHLDDIFGSSMTRIFMVEREGGNFSTIAWVSCTSLDISPVVSIWPCSDVSLSYKRHMWGGG